MNPARSRDFRVLEVLQENYGSLSRKQRKLSDFIFANHTKVAFTNAAGLARDAGVSESTVSRLVSALGYPNYTRFQEAFRELLQDRLSILERYPFQQGGGADIYSQVVSMEGQMLSRMAGTVSRETMNAVTDLLCGAEDAVVAGTGANACLVDYTSYFLGIIGPRVHKISDADVESLIYIRKLPENSMALVFSFPRYPRQTQDILKSLEEKGIPIVGVTDSMASPIIPYTTHALVVPQKYISFMDPLGAVMALVHALLTGVYLKDREGSRRKVEEFDRYCNAQDLMVRKDIDVAGLI